MDYEFWFWMLVAFLAGRYSQYPIFYYGNNEEKYHKAWIAFLRKD